MLISSARAFLKVGIKAKKEIEELLVTTYEVRKGDAVTDEARREPFIGIKIANRLQQQLDDCDSINERYFDGSEPQSLQIVTIDGQQILGRTVEQGASIDSLEDVAQNIRSILLKICPKYNIGDSKIKVYAQTIGHD